MQSSELLSHPYNPDTASDTIHDWEPVQVPVFSDLPKQEKTAPVPPSYAARIVLAHIYSRQSSAWMFGYVGARVDVRHRSSVPSPISRYLRNGWEPSVSQRSSEYADVVDMLRHLHSLNSETTAYLRQRDAIFERCLPLADHVARRFRGRGEAFDDLVQAARLGLVNAVDRFDVDSGKAFLSFAIPTMMGEVRRHFRDRGWALKVPRRMKEVQPQLARASAELAQQLGRAPTASEVAERLGVDRELVVDAMVAHTSYATVSTDAVTGPDDQNRSIGESLGALDPAFDKVLDTETVRPLIAALPERQRTVITLRFFEEMTQSEIAERVGCSQMHVSRLLAKALHTLRVGAHQPEFAAVS